MTNSLWWPIILSTFLVIAGLLLLIAPGVSTAGEEELRPWQTFDAVVIPDLEDEELAVQRLRNAGETVLYAGNASLLIEDFDGGAEVPIANLSQRLDPDDPRLDPFSSALITLFRGGGAGDPVAIIYLDRSGSLVSRWMELERHLAGVDFYLLGWQPVLPVAAGTVVFLSLLPVVFALRRRRSSAVAILLVVTIYTVRAGPNSVIPAILAGLAWAYWNAQSYELEREWLNYGRIVRLEQEHVPALILLVAACTAMVATAPTPSSGGGVMAALVGIWSVGVAAHRWRVRRSEHPLFAPRRILRARVTFPGLLPALSIGVAGSAALLTIGTILGGPVGELSAPVPEHLAVGQPSGERAEHHEEADEDLERIVEGMRALSPVDEPLSTAGYLAHRWYQETLIYGGRYEVPGLNQVLELQRLRRGPTGLEAYQSEVGRFNQEWISRQFSTPPGSAYRLFIEERGAFRIRFQPLRFAVVDMLTYGRRVGLLLIPFIALAVGIRLPYRGLLGTVGTVSRSERQ